MKTFLLIFTIILIFLIIGGSLVSLIRSSADRNWDNFADNLSTMIAVTYKLLLIYYFINIL